MCYCSIAMCVLALAGSAGCTTRHFALVDPRRTEFTCIIQYYWPSLVEFLSRSAYRRRRRHKHKHNHPWRPYPPSSLLRCRSDANVGVVYATLCQRSTPLVRSAVHPRSHRSSSSIGNSYRYRPPVALSLARSDGHLIHPSHKI